MNRHLVPLLAILFAPAAVLLVPAEADAQSAVGPRAAGAATSSADGTLELETIYPRFAGQNRVRWWEFDWKWTDLRPVDDAAKVRLYFYEEEREVAGIAGAYIQDTYREYVERFDYRPSRTTPLLLYNSHFEFESTNAFLVQEQVLGVTSVEDLTLALPYWGEHERFRHVLRHEMAHVFTIQLVGDAAEEAGVRNPLPGIPLWFIEGVAEYFALGDLTPEKRGVLAARLLDIGDVPNIPDFFDEGPMDFERIYQIGHAQVLFLEEVFGPGTARRILAAAPSLAGRSRFRRERLPDFRILVSRVVDVAPDEINRRWRRWLTERIGEPAHAFAQPMFALESVEDLGPGEIDSYALGPDGRTILYRTFDPRSGIARLFLQDLEDPGSRIQIAEDQRPGMVSLHPQDRSVTAVGEDRIAWIGRVAATDVVFVRSYRRRTDGDRVRFDLGKRVKHEIEGSFTLIEAGDPAFDPTTGALVFMGLSRERGFLDVYRIGKPLERNAPIARITDDRYVQRDLAFLPDGTLVMASDATTDGNYEIFRMDDGAPRQITRIGGEADVFTPAPDDRGGIVFTSGRSGWLQAYRMADPLDPERRFVRGEDRPAARLTGIPTWFRRPTVDHEGNLLGLALTGRRSTLVTLRPSLWLDERAEIVAAGPTEPWNIPEMTFDEVHDYNAFAFRNLEIADAALLFSSGPFFIGRLVGTDRFQNHIFGFQGVVIESFDRSEAEIFYLDRSGRWSQGGTAFVQTALQLDPEFAETGESYLIRKYGLLYLAQYPFGRFSRIEGSAGPMAFEAFEFFDDTGPFAQRYRGVFPAARLGIGYGLDTIRQRIFGAAEGYSFVANADGTWVFQGLRDAPAGGRTNPDPFVELRTDANAFRPLGRNLTGPYLHGRIAAGTSFGGVFRDQYYLPAAYNMRAYPPGSLALLGQHYYVTQAELLVPINFGGGFVPGIEAVAGADFGSIFFEPDGAWDRRAAAGVLGANVILGPMFTLRLHFARPVDIGTGVTTDGWITHFTIDSPFLRF